MILQTALCPALFALATWPCPLSDPGSIQDGPQAGKGSTEPLDLLDQAELERLTASIQADIELLRSAKFPRAVSVRVTDLAGLQSYLKEQLAEQQSPEELHNEETAAHLLGVIAPETNLIGLTLQLLEEQVGGFYEPSEERFYLMDRFTGGVAKVILAHELTHALDDQLYDLDGQLEARKENTDAQLAFHAVAEGSGTATMIQWTKKHLRELKLSDLADAPSMESPTLALAPPYVWKPLLASYMRGASFLARSDNVMVGQSKVPSAEDLARAFTHPPLSMEQVLHPEKYWDPAQWDAPRRIAFVGADLPRGWTVLNEDTLGELGLALLTWPLDDRAGLDIKNPFAPTKVRYSHPATEGWGGDRMLLLGRDGARILHLVSLWDSETDAAEFEAATVALQDHLRSSAADLAGKRAVQGSGCLVHRTDDLVLVTSWIGAGQDEVQRVLAGLPFEEQTGAELASQVR